MAGKDTRRKLADFDRHYMPDGVPEPEASVTGTTGGIDNGCFVVSPDTVWYARVLLLFSASAMTDTGSKTFECALVSTLETYDNPENGNYCINYMHYINYVLYLFMRFRLAGWNLSVPVRLFPGIEIPV